MHQGDRKALYLLFSFMTRIAGDDNHFIDTHPAKSHELAADQRHSLQSYERLGNTTHAPTFASGEQDRTDMQPRVQSTTSFKHAAH